MYILLSGWIKVTAGAVYLIQCVYMYMYSLMYCTVSLYGKHFIKIIILHQNLVK